MRSQFLGDCNALDAIDTNGSDLTDNGVLILLRRLKESGVQVGAVSNGNAEIVKIPALAGLFDFAV